MARSFTGDSNQHLAYPAGVVLAPPFTLATWFFVVDSTATRALVTLYQSSNEHTYLRTSSGNEVEAYTEAGGTSSRATTSTTFTDSTWNHGCAIFAAANNRSALLNAGGKDTETTSRVPTEPDETFIGIRGSAQDMNGRLAEVGIWNVALTDAEVTILAAGYAPSFVRPQSLVSYWRLIRDEDLDHVGGSHMTPQNSPTVGPHPPIIYPAYSPILVAPTAAPGGLSIPVAIHHLRQQRIA
jgi:hypothetical protein